MYHKCIEVYAAIVAPAWPANIAFIVKRKNAKATARKVHVAGKLTTHGEVTMDYLNTTLTPASTRKIEVAEINEQYAYQCFYYRCN